ncbi:MAG TPA: bacillithiol biosynthesis cysteine-adding enzyme BshC [Gemmatimonadaceae bacterium]|nr:bacillithiol biosynthesis cysteine-adding enzyme BshC [Gemmatimonadaceae bacterium]
MNPRIVTQPLAGNPLAAAVIAGNPPPGWYEPVPADAGAWRERLESVRLDFPKDWLARLAPAFEATGRAKERLEASSGGRGVVVTTGQQPGLFGGPMYTLNKALSVLALADVLQKTSGVPVAPVFWAATDDTDFKEASSTVVSVPGGAQLLRIDHAEPLGRTMAVMPLGDVSAQLEALTRAAGSTIDRGPIELLEKFYESGQTIGSAYVSLLRALLAPLGVAVIDAYHPATRAAAKPVLNAALEKAEDIAKRVSERNREIEAAGFSVQVQDVPGLSLVFGSSAGGRKRIPIKVARKQGTAEDLGPNVLLRPVVERAILPTATYVGGPAEIAYFAQVSPIAETLGVARPAIVPRWSATIMEPHVERILSKLHLVPEDFRDPHEVEARVARAHLPKRVIDELNATRALLDKQLEKLSAAVEEEDAPVSAAVTGGLGANLLRRLDRFERRLIAAAKKQHAEIMQEIATARGSLYPLGKPQERALNFVPFLARYGAALRDDLLAEASEHAKRLVGAQAQSRPLEEAIQARGRS